MFGILTALRRRLRRVTGPRPVILMYHRVAELEVDPWELAVTPVNFAEQMDYLKRHRTPLPMAEFVARHATGTLPANAVGVTFDDGYIDNLLHAKPALSAAGVPATLFVVTGRLANAQPFWWDELARLILGHRGASDDAIDIAGIDVPLRWPADDAVAEERSWRAWDPPRTPRHSAYLEIWTRLRAVSEAERAFGMSWLHARLGPVDRAGDLPMTTAQLDELRGGGLIDLGGHSVSHPALTTLTRAQRREEIEGCRHDLARLLDVGTSGFAYPYGDMNDAVRADVAHGGFAWACSTEGACIDPSSDPFALPRLTVGNWNAARFAANLAAA
jgi:peptidoglycan/xylan/chitin deacetylase (PgdA/CDA1 family)